MKVQVLLFLIVLISCKENKKNIVQESTSTAHFFYVGTWTNADSKGIYKYSLHEDGSLERIALSAKSDYPSFLTKSADGQFLVAVSEVDEDGVGYVESYLIKGDSLELLSKTSSGGAHPCFVTMNEEGYILVGNYTGGNVGLLKLNEEGKLTELLDLQEHEGNGGTERQKSPHAHSVWFDGDESIISIDFGTNELWFSDLDTVTQKLVPTNSQLSMDSGAGPRHLVFHPNKKNWLYVVNELNATITRVAKNENGTFEKKESISTLPEGYKEDSFCADIHISADGKFVYASNRGHNSIAIFSVDQMTGELTSVGYESTKGDWPRNFSLSPNEDFLLVANQNTNNIVSYKRDSETGLLTFVAEIEAPTPVCILF